MSISFSLNIKLEKSVQCKEIIELLFQNGWNIVKNGEITYLPLNDDDMFNWTVSKNSLSNFMKLVDEKEKINELIGVEINWSNTNIGGHLLFYSGSDFSFQLNVNTKCLKTEYKIPDFNWYAEKIISVLIQQYYIREYSFELT